MSKIEFVDVKGGYNLSAINTNFNRIKETIDEDLLSRANSGGEPNEMKQDLDMNGNHIYNLPYPESDNEPVRRGDVAGLVGEAAGLSANLIKFEPYKSIESTNVQDAIEELKDELDAVENEGVILEWKRVTNHLWAGFFRVWQAGEALTGRNYREVAFDGGTMARIDGSTGFNVARAKGVNYPDCVQIQRNATNTSISPIVITMTLSPQETAPLRGKEVILRWSSLKGDTYSGTEPKMIVCGSAENFQAIRLTSGRFTNGNQVLAEQVVSLQPGIQPAFMRFTVPANMNQIAVLIELPFLGTADITDWMRFEGVGLIEGTQNLPMVVPENETLLARAQRRYISSYPYGTPRGTPLHAGAISTVATTTASYIGVNYAARWLSMEYPPTFYYYAPSTGGHGRLTKYADDTEEFGNFWDVGATGATVSNNAVVVAGTKYTLHTVAIAFL